jgi:hypothetical protein
MSGYTGLTVSPFFNEGNQVGEEDIEMNNADRSNCSMMNMI